MTLEERLRELPEDDYVYLGNGFEGFFCITQVKDVKANIELELSRRRRLVDNRIRRASTHITICEQRITEYATKMYEASTKKEVDNIRQVIRDAREDIDDDTKTLAEMNLRKSKLDSAYDVLNAEITEEYARKWVKPLGRIILIDYPILDGKYWFLNEFKRGSATV